MAATPATDLPYRVEAPFILAPSVLLAEQAAAEGRLVEGKALGTAELHDLSLLRDLVHPKDMDPDAFARARDVGTRVGWRKYAQVKERTEAALRDLLRQWKKGRLAEPDFRKQATRTMKQAWRDVFLAGIRASGTAPSGLRGKGDPLVVLAPRDDNWLRSAVQHEMRFLNKFLDAAVSGDFVMPLEHRVRMYADALDAFYDSARVIGLPNNTAIHWVTPGDRVSCPSCVFLQEHSPYTTETIPCVPRAGMTLCLCLLDCDVDIVTRRGILPWSAVQVGDQVWTHRGRWRRVTAKHVNRSTEAHRYAVLVGPRGELTGVTSDHPVWTNEGWCTAADAAQRDLRVLPCVPGADPSKLDGALPGVLGAGAVAGRAGSAQAPRTARSGAPTAYAVRESNRATLSPAGVGRTLRGSVLARQPDVLRLPVPLAVGAGARTYPEGVVGSSSERGPHRRSVGESRMQGPARASRGTPGQGREDGTVLLGCTRRGEQPLARRSAAEDLPALREDLPGSTEHGQEPPEEVLLAGVSQRRAYAPSGVDLRRVPAELHAPGVRGPQVPARAFLLADLLQQRAGEGMGDPAVRLLREEVQASGLGRSEGEEVEAGQVLLLSGVLPSASSLYDLEVEDDHSFVAGGLTVHNSNCRDWLYIRRVSESAARRLREDAAYTRDGFIRKLRKIKRTGHP